MHSLSAYYRQGVVLEAGEALGEAAATEKDSRMISARSQGRVSKSPNRRS